MSSTGLPRLVFIYAVHFTVRILPPETVIVAGEEPGDIKVMIQQWGGMYPSLSYTALVHFATLHCLEVHLILMYICRPGSISFIETDLY